MITIIGAGPVGCYAASLLAEDFEVAVFEEHSQVGLPVQCTGILTQEIYDYFPRRNNSVLNQVNNVRIFAPDKKSLKLQLEKPDLIVDRQKFDTYFYNQARKKGVKFYFSYRFMGIKDSKILVKDLNSGKTKSIKFDYLIGADGPLSPVAKAAGIFKNRKFFIGVQAVIKKKNSNIIDFYPFKHGFGWAVPENKSILRVGVAATTNPKEHFARLLKRYKGKIVTRQGGLIPVFNPAAIVRKANIFLIGDAAGFVKATTGGGIIPGLRSAQILAHSLKYNLSYEAGLYLHLYPSLWANLKMRKAMDDFSEQEWSQLVKDLNSAKARKALQSINRDEIFSLLFKLGSSKPSLAKYGLKHLRSFF
ncbi:NAD(P)/FAD-dependent oxidoreductase [Candidatus Woesearchaeota archaeon]|nr:NAD(P)/FAD-dependent oxidoreductase [Candidatus Woesearchaeota archaeon]